MQKSDQAHMIVIVTFIIFIVLEVEVLLLCHLTRLPFAVNRLRGTDGGLPLDDRRHGESSEVRTCNWLDELVNVFVSRYACTRL